MIWIAITLFGIVAATSLRIERLPWIELPEAHVVVEFAGLPASRMESLITVPLENALSSIRAVEEIEAITQVGISVVRLQLKWGASLDAVAVDIRAAIDILYPSLPEGVERPTLFLGERLSRPLAILAVYSSAGSTAGPAGGPAAERSFEGLDRIITHDLRPALRRIDGMGLIQVLGTLTPEIVVEADASRLRGAAIALADVAGAIQAALPDQSVGVVIDRGREREVRVSADISSIEALDAIPLSAIGGIEAGNSHLDVSVGELAEARWDTKPRSSLFRVDGRDAVGVHIYKRPGFGSINALLNLRRSLPELGRRYAGELEIVELTDRNELIDSFGSLVATLLLGILATLLITGLLLGSRRAAIIIALIIPISVAGCLLCMSLGGLSLNSVSLAGIAIGIGMIVDNGILVLDNLSYRRARTRQQVADATLEIITSAAGGTLTTLLVFIPLLLIPGVSGALFRELALAVIFVLAISFLAAATLIPALYLQTPFSIRTTRWLRSLEHVYGCYLLRARPVIVAACLALFVAIGLVAWFSLPKVLASAETSLRMEGQLFLRRDLSIEAIVRQAELIEAELLQLPEVESLLMWSGHHPDSVRDRALPSQHISTLNLSLVLTPHFGSEIADMQARIGELLTAAIGDDWLLSSPRSSFEQLLGLRESVDYRLTGPHRQALLLEAERLRTAILEAGSDAGNGIAAGRTVIVDTRPTASRYRLQLHREATAYYGFDTRAALAQLRVAVRGTVVGALNIDHREVDVRVRMAPRYSSDPQAIERLRIATRRGHIELGDLGRLRRETDYNALYRWNRAPAVTLTIAPHFADSSGSANSIGSSDSSGRERLMALLASYRPQTRQVSGDMVGSSRLAGHYRSIILLFVLACSLIFLVLGAEMDSAARSLLALGILIPALAGSSILLALGGADFDLHAAIGILILLGVCVNAAILLLEAYRRGKSGHIIAKSIVRLRPALATLATTVVALVPIALSGRREAATALAVIGGMCGGTLAALLLIPMLYLRPSARAQGARARGA